MRAPAEFLENGTRLVIEPGSAYAHMQHQTYESNVPFVLRYMIDRSIVGGNWLEIKKVFGCGVCLCCM